MTLDPNDSSSDGQNFLHAFEFPFSLCVFYLIPMHNVVYIK